MRLICEMHTYGSLLNDEALVCVELTNSVLNEIAVAQAAVEKLRNQNLWSPTVQFSATINEVWELPCDPVCWDERHTEGYILRRRTTYTHLEDKDWGKGYEFWRVYNDGVYLNFSQEYGGEWESQWIPMKALLENRKTTVLHFAGQEIIMK